MKVATVLESACPFFMILKHNGTISVCMRKVMAYGSLSLTSAPMTPKDVTLKFSKILLLVEVLRNGYRNNGICAFRNYWRVCWWRARHWSRPTTRQMRLELVSLRLGGGDSSEYISMISWSKIVMVPTECHSNTGKSGYVSLFLLNKLSAFIVIYLPLRVSQDP